MKILITGATGLVGKELGKLLSEKGHQIVVVSRNKEKAIKELPFYCQVIEGDLVHQEVKLPADIQFVFHLMGENVSAKRWNDKVKSEILKSRVDSTQNLIQSLKEAPQMFISASAIGYYGHRPKEILTEQSSADKSFLSQVCQSWEDSVLSINKKFPETQVACLRLGVVLSQMGGALEKMLFPFKLGVGGALGDGSHFMSWIHIKDLVHMFHFVLEKRLSGFFNAVAPESVDNLTFSKNLAAGLQRSLGPSVPKKALELMFGEMASVVLADQNVSAGKIQSAGFQFEYKTIESAFSDLLEPMKKTNEFLVSEQFIPMKQEELFPFFAEAKNLEVLTPQTLSFKIKTMSTAKIQKGTLIDYVLKIHGVPVGWRTLIEEWNPSQSFVDTQLKGPYSLWHHTHEFIKVPGGTLMRDKVQFRLPLGYLGWIGGRAFVKSDVNKIFSYRREKIYELFVKPNYL